MRAARPPLPEPQRASSCSPHPSLLTLPTQYTAEKIYAINEHGLYRPPSSLDDAARLAQDEEIFQRTRLVNCGFFMQIILGDYVGAILGLVRDGRSWRLKILDVRASMLLCSARG